MLIARTMLLGAFGRGRADLEELRAMHRLMQDGVGQMSDNPEIRRMVNEVLKRKTMIEWLVEIWLEPIRTLLGK